MTGQLNTSLLNSNSEEIQEELDTLSNRLDGVESVTSANTDKINEVGTKVDNLSKSVSTGSLTATAVKATSIDSSSAAITNLTAGTATISNKLNAANIEATAITAGNINGDVSAGTIDATNVSATNADVAGKITAASAKLIDAEITNAKANTATVTGKLSAGSVKADSAEAVSLNAQSAAISSLCVCNDAQITGTATVNCVISENIQANGAINTASLTASCICGSVQSENAKITSATIDNLTVSSTLTVADGIALPNTLGDTAFTKATADSLVVNGDTELNGTVKAGSITIGDGSITAGEVCIGAKGVAIDADKNAAFADVTAATVAADAATISGKITADCIESKDIVSTNAFACNLYPENITIDKDVGNLHYSRQLDTDAIGGILVDCKTVLPKEDATGVISKYKDTEANTINEDNVEYVNEKNGIKIVSSAEADKTTNAVSFDTGSNVFTVKADETGFSILTDGNKSFGISTDGIVEQEIGNCPTDVRTDNILKANEDGSLYAGCVDLLGDASKKCNGWTKTKKENACAYSLTTNYDTGTVQRCHVETTDDSSTIDTYCNLVKSGTDIDYKCLCTGHNINGYWNYFSCKYVDSDCNWQINYCENADNTGFKSFTTYTINNGKYVAIDTIKNITCKTKPLPTVISRNLSDNTKAAYDDLAWKVCINESNLYITNPQKTTDTGCAEDILRVEDGKIYTKCGEFVAGSGGSGGYFEDATFENDCICAVRSIVDDTITTCVVTKKDSYNNKFSIINNPYSVVLSCHEQSYLPKCLTFYGRSRYGYSWLTPIAVQCQCNRDYNCSLEYDFLNQSMTITDEDGRVVCYETQDQNIANCYKFNSDTNVCTLCERAYCEQACIPEAGQCGILYCIDCCDYSFDTGLECNCYHCEQYGLQAVSSPTLWVTKCCYNTNIEHDGSETPYCVGYSRSCICPGTYTFCFENSCRDICACSCSEEGDYRICYDCGTIHYDCNSTYTRFFNGECLCGCKYNTTTCQYETFDVHSCINIDDKSINKSVMINNCYISLKEKVVDNTIANLPTTNALVPLAGTVNGNGFAFFCKGADGAKFYDSSFAIVDAGSATDITYLVTTGA